MHLHIRTNRLLILDIFVITCKESLLLQCAHTPWVNADGTRFVPLVSSMGAKCKHAGTNIVDMELIRLFFFITIILTALIIVLRASRSRWNSDNLTKKILLLLSALLLPLLLSFLSLLYLVEIHCEVLYFLYSQIRFIYCQYNSLHE